MTPEALVEATAGPVNALGARFYFDGATLARGKEAGLDGFRFYVLGRGGVLGDVPSPVVASAFGYFNPQVIAKIWNSAREKLSPTDAATLYLDCCADIGRGAVDGLAGLAEFCEAAEQVIADLSPAGLPLYAGIAAQPLPKDLPGRAMQLAAVHRELRGSIHLAATVGAGLEDRVAHALRRPNDVETFGWAEGVDIPEGSQARLDAVDAATDVATANAYRSLSDTRREAFADGVAAMTAAFEG